MATIIKDTLPTDRTDSGGRCHDLLGTGCDPFIWKLMNNADFDRTCYNNLARAIAPYHLTEFDVHDVLNLFQVTGLDADGMYFTEPSPAQKGDYVELFAEIDLLCAISNCPGGDLSVPLFGSDHEDPLATCRPIDIEVYEQAHPALLAGWNSPQPVDALPLYGAMSPQA